MKSKPVTTAARSLGRQQRFARMTSNTNIGVVADRLAWFLMESPNLWIAVIVYSLTGGGNVKTSLANQILLGCFAVHYIHRAVIFPMRLPKSAPMPITVMLLALFYCTWNGAVQSLSLIVVNKYPDSWTRYGVHRAPICAPI
jgi:hypothetical protein